MEIKEFKEKIGNAFREIKININDNQKEKFFTYMKTLLMWNEHINLTAITDEDQIIIKHFLDSGTILQYIKSDDIIVDIGTGAGFPGIPINIMTNCNVTLVDSLNKRVNFLKHICKELNLENINCIHSRAEELAQDNQHRERYTIVVSRAVATLNVLLEYCLPLLKLRWQIYLHEG